MRPGARRALLIGGGFMGALLLIVLIGIFVLTQTDWGRERVRRFGVGRLAGMVNGIVQIGRIEGNVLTGATLIDVLITDSAGAPFLRADTVKLSYSLRTMYSKRLIFRDVYVAHPVVVIDRPPGGEWNYDRLFRSEPVPGDTIPGFGSWVRFDGLTISAGDFTVRDRWAPHDSITGRARERAVADALSEANRRLIVAVPGGYQSVMYFRNVDAVLPYVRWADPDSANRIFQVASATMTALPFRPPPAEVRGLEGTIVVSEDTAYFNDMVVTLPSSTVMLDGHYAMIDDGQYVIRARSQNLAFADIRFLRPQLPEGGGSVDATITNPGNRYHFVARALDLAAEGARVAGSIDVLLTDPPRLGPSDITFNGFDTQLMRRFTDVLPPELHGVANGSVRLAGTTESMDVDGWTSFRERGGALSRIDADGHIGNAPGGIETDGLLLRFSPLSVSLLRAFSPEIRFAGLLNGTATLTGSTDTGFRINSDLTHDQRGFGRSHVIADGDIRFDDGVTMRNLRLRLDPLQVALIKAYRPDLKFDGTLAGSATLTGSTRSGVDMDADITHEQAGIGRSRILADGALRFGNEVVARNLRLDFQPLQSALVRTFRPSLPLDGIVTGRATLNGPLEREVRAAVDLAHEGEAGTSQAIGNVMIGFSEIPRFTIDVRTPVLALGTPGRFVPSAGLRGTAHGRISASGTLRDFTLDTDLAVDGGGRANVQGQFDLYSAQKSYDFTGRFDAFDAASVTRHAPTTLLSGTVAASGVGTDPATARATLRADLVDSRVSGVPTVDTTRVHLRFADGLATAEQGQIRLGSTRADFEGTFGLIEGRTGELRYSVFVDSLHQFREVAALTDTTVVSPRPMLQARVIARARADSARIAQETEVERAATGKPALPTLAFDTISSVRRDSIGGSVRAEGVLTGNIKRFDARGTAELDHATIAGSSAARGRIAYALTGFGTSTATYDVTASFDSLRTGGFAFDSTAVKLQYAGLRNDGNGSAQISIFQDPDRDYTLDTQFRLALDRKEMLLNRVALRMDSTQWNSTTVGAVRWAGDGFQLDNIELRSNEGGRIYADGRIPQEGTADLDLALERVRISNITALLQDTTQALGILTLDARVQGTRESPTLNGTVALDSASYGGKPVPDVRGTFAYANTELETHLEAVRGSMRLATADARLPINLALTGVTGSRLLDRELAANIVADSLPLDALPSFTNAIDEIRGRVRGNATIAGTFSDARVEGTAELDLGAMRVVPAGVRYRDINGVIHFAGDTARVDSIVARAGGGSIRVGGSVAMAELLRPGFNLTINAERAQLINNDYGRLDGDAQLTLTGALDSPRVEGTMRIRGGVIYAPEMDHRRATNLDLPTLAQVADTSMIADAIIGRPHPFVENLGLDVAVDVDRNTWVRNAKANAEIYTPVGEPVRITMSRGQSTIAIAGSVNAERGEYAYAGRTFLLTTGTATFLEGVGEINPLIQLNGQYLVPRPGREALVIQISVSGMLTKPTVALTSNSQPPLSQSQLLSLFAFGQTSSSALNLHSSGLAGGSGLSGITTVAEQQLAGLALGALAEEAVADIQREGTRAGLDVFRIHAAALPEELGFDDYFQNVLKGTEIVAGKYVSPRLYVAAQGRMNRAIPGLRAEYRTPSGFSLESTWELRYLPTQPTLDESARANESRTFGLFLYWTRRF